ncbi:MAG: phosphotransferase, partial [Gammaproteobacteria bacterium]|nr:phosphotransferase [Gammaproteobacteria bacterium]
ADLTNVSTVRALMKMLRQLHESKERFEGKVDLSGLLNRYFQLIPDHQQRDIKDIYQRAVMKLKTLPDDDNEPVPSHNDLVLENILIDDSQRIWIIDWEYASMAPPWWDLATLCNSAGLGRDDSAQLLKIYRGEVSKTALRLLIDYRYILQVLSICWLVAFTETDVSRQIEKLSSSAEYP